MSTATDAPRNESTNMNNFNRAAPIPILPPPHRRRPSTTSSDGSPPSPPSIQTPNSVYPTNLAPSSPTSSSFLSYLISTSPKSNASFPYRRPPGLGAPPVFEDEEGQEIDVRNSLHQRRATTGWAGNSSGRAASQRSAPAPPVIEAQHARGAGVLRRLSLGGGLKGVCSFDSERKSTPYLNVFTQSAFQGAPNGPASPPPPATPPPSAVSPPPSPGFAANQNNTGVRRVRRAATLSVPSTNSRHRAPSPMGERILKGHFDGFN
ncbi:hypothetical protein BC826DRAFT_971356 [Russula brevipes]|nr:hypothetical protein BC826DRAFT_971356 [Russula brevipes]